MNVNYMDQLIAVIIAVITTIVSFKSLKQCGVLDNPVISICVGILVYVSFSKFSESTATAVLFPYQALGIAILLGVLALLINVSWRRRFSEDSENKDESELHKED